ncbi:MAG: class I SAM-dependent methyltransferase [Armatimonadota bacterium]
MVDAVKCPVCGSDSWNTTIQGDGFSVVICAKGCIARTDPAPPPEDNVPPVDGFTETTRDAISSVEFRFAERIYGRLSRFKTSGRLLDVGSGGGHLVKIARERGFDAVGIEMTELGVEYARCVLDIHLISGSFPEHEFEPESFDVVVMKHVLEHIPDPGAAVSEANRILRPGGIVVIESPNFNSLMRKVKGAEWEGLQPGQHAWQLSPSSVSKLLVKYRLSTLYVNTEHLEYRRGNGSLARWAALRTILGIADILRMQDNFTVIGVKSPV